MVVHAFNSSFWESEAGISLWVQGHSGLHREILPRETVSKNQNKTTKPKTLKNINKNQILDVIWIKNANHVTFWWEKSFAVSYS